MKLKALILVAGVVFGAVLLFALTSFSVDVNLPFLGGGEDQKSTPYITNSLIVIQDVKTMAMLETASGDVLIEKTAHEDKSSVLKDAEVTMRYVGRIKAGMDLSLITEDSVALDPLTNKVEVTLPPIQITSCSLLNPEVVENACGTNVPMLSDCAETLDKLQREAYRSSMESLLASQETSDIIEKAYDRAYDQVFNLLDTLGFERIVLIRSSETPVPDSSCLP